MLCFRKCRLESLLWCFFTLAALWNRKSTVTHWPQVLQPFQEQGKAILRRKSPHLVMQCVGLSALGCKPRSICSHARVPALGNNAGGILLTVFTACSSALRSPCSSLDISISIFSISRPSLRHFAILNYSALALPHFPSQRILVSLSCSRCLYFFLLGCQEWAL